MDIEDTKQKRLYEIGYLLDPNLKGGGVGASQKKLESFIKDLGGKVFLAERPIFQQLAYPIKKQKSAYFGYLVFNLVPDQVVALKEKLRYEADFLRNMIFQKLDKEFKPKELRPKIFRRPALPRKPLTKEKPQPPELKKEPEVDLSELDRKLEELFK